MNDYHTYKFERKKTQKQSRDKRRKRTNNNKYQQHSGYIQTYVRIAAVYNTLYEATIKYFQVLFGETHLVEIAYIQAI